MNTEQSELTVRPLYGRAIGAGLVGLAALAGVGVTATPAQAIVSTYDLKAAKKFYDGGGTDMYLKYGVNVAAGDLDGDGATDIVVSGTDGVANTLDYLKFEPLALNFTKIEFDYRPRDSSRRGIATGDVNGDGFPDLIVGDNSGASSGLRAGGGRYTKLEVEWLTPSFSAFSTPMSNGVNIAVGDLDGDGQAEIIAGPTASPLGAATTSKIRRISMSSSKGRTGDITSYMKFVDEFAVYGNSYTGGIRVATGDVDGDGRADLVTIPQTGLDRLVVTEKLGAGGATGYIKIDSFNVVAPSADTPINIAAGDVNGDGACDIVLAIGGGPGGGPRVDVYSQVAITGGPEATWALNPALSLSSAELGFPSGYTGELSIALGNIVGDSSLDLIVANAAPVPEPASLAAMSLGAAALLGRRRRRSCSVPTS
jgi:hypothetical protein